MTSTEPAAEPAAPPAFRLGNRPPLTGICALVIGSILAYHSNFTALPGAWAAISVFFVLSSFLITSMLVAERDRTGRISLGHFYARRAFRLLPPLFMVVAGLAVCALVVSVPDAAQRIWGDISAALFYYADFRSASGREPFLGYLAQAWSLSIEEQFYVIWSLLMLAAVTLGRCRLATLFPTAGVALSVSYSLWLLLHAPHFTTAVNNRVYFGFGSRAYSLFVGCILGLVATGGHLEGRGPAFRRAISATAVIVAALLAWIVAYGTLGTREARLWWMPLSVVCAVAIISYFVACPDGIGSRLVGIAPLVLVGNLAYTLYLVHWPVYVALSPQSTYWSFWLVEVARMAIVFSFALLSWYLVEQPLMRRRRRRWA